ncbi:MAG: glycosyltransferase family 4 protein [Chitinophagaceae bacterium]
MKIISLTWYKILPAVFGGQKGIACFNESLANHFPLTCLCSSNNEPGNNTSYKVLPELPVSKSQFINPFCWSKISSIAQAEQATHIILEHPYHGIAANRAAKKCGAMLILHAHNIESERFRELGKWGWRILRAYEKWIHRKAALVLFKTSADRDFAIAHFGINADKCLLIPYGINRKKDVDRNAASEKIRQRHGIPSANKILLFAGTLDYEPNAEAVEAIYSKIAPALEGKPHTIIICGKNGQSVGRPHPMVINAGEVEDIDEYFAAADVFINPVCKGGGVQTKNVEALANDCNVVCFEKMVDREMRAVAGNKLFIANDWLSFVTKIEEAAIVSNKISDSFFEYYDCDVIIQRLVTKLENVSA